MPEIVTSGRTAQDTGELVEIGSGYEVLELIGKGGMASVYKVRDINTGKSLAIKVLSKELLQEPALVGRFNREAEAMRRLTHANIVAVYTHTLTVDGAPYMVMDYIDGKSLADILKTELSIDVARATDIFVQVTEGICHAHMKGVVHRDMKPSNIIITTRENGSQSVKIVDFGIATILPAAGVDSHHLTQTGDVFGSPLYMSPEQCRGESVDSRTDIYSLGCVMYETLSGKPPLEGANPIQIILNHINKTPANLRQLPQCANVSEWLEAVIMRCLAKDPAQRYASAELLLSDLAAIRDGFIPPNVRSFNFDSPSLARRASAAAIDGAIVGSFVSVTSAVVESFCLWALPSVPISLYQFQSTFLLQLLVYLPRSFLDATTCFVSMYAFLLWLPLSLQIAGGTVAQAMLGWLAFQLISNWLYRSIFESSRLQATPGKAMLGLRVTQPSGERLSFKRSTIRHFAKVLLPVVPYILLVRLFPGQFPRHWSPAHMSRLIEGVVARPPHDVLADALVTARKGESIQAEDRILIPKRVDKRVFQFENRRLKLGFVFWLVFGLILFGVAEIMDMAYHTSLFALGCAICYLPILLSFGSAIICLHVAAGRRGVETITPTALIDDV